MTDRYTNRELSWLDFNDRVLALAGRTDWPLLERVKFLAIWANNLDEFFQVRVAGLMEQVFAGVTSKDPAGLTPSRQLELIRPRVADAYRTLAKLYHDDVEPLLNGEGISIVDYGSLDEEDRHHLDREFDERVYPVLTPLAVDPSHPFPYISNLSLNLAVFVLGPDDTSPRFARIKVPPILPRLLKLPGTDRFVPLEQLIAAHLDVLFPGMRILARYPFRVTRNADLDIEEDEADDLVAAISEELRRRKFGRVVRLEVETGMSREVLSMLSEELGVGPEDVYVVEPPLDATSLFAVAGLDRPDLQHPVYKAVTQPVLAPVDGDAPDIFSVLREDDVLVQHPYEAFGSSVEEFIRQAAADPKVLAIKQTVYRTSSDSTVLPALIAAAERGKQVVAVVEVKARFDEERNIEWARRLEESGVHVVYGMVGLKTHSKVALVVRREEDRIVRYAHIGTGNYNASTAKTYEDLGLLTADPDLGADLSDLFNFITGYSRQTEFRKLLVAPSRLRSRIVSLIRREAEEEDGHIVMKINSLVDAGIIDELYAASEKGTRIELIVRGICCLRPGVPGQSDNIHVRSIVGRYLEHSRIFRFGSPGRGYDYYLGSADMMGRNLDRRIEVLTPVERPDLRSRLDEILSTLLRDDNLAWSLDPTGRWHPVPGQGAIETHVTLQRAARRRTSSPRF